MTPDTPTQAAALPELPSTVFGLFYEAAPSADDEGYQELIDAPGYTADQMRAYAQQALQEACAERDALRAMVGELVAVGTNTTPHRHWGGCPDVVDGYDSRDEDCPACRVLMRADELIDTARKEGA